VYGLNLVAESPYWRGEPVTRKFEPAGAAETYYGGATGGGFGPDYHIMRAATLSTATVTNDGDVPTSPVWKINGPSTSAQVGLDGHLVTFPMTLSAGQWITLDTAPTSQVALDQSGNDRTAELGLVDFWKIPKGTSVPLSLSMAGAGSIEVTVTPEFFRAL
jgi:hypothetical protein